MILIALDVGEKRIGVAVSDALGMFAHPREAIQVGGKAEFRALIALFLLERPAEIVIGYPIELSGQRGERAKWVERFRDRLRGHLNSEPLLQGLKLTLWDERLSSVQAERALRSAGHFKEKQKSMTDSLAAAFILEAYMQSKETEARPATREKDSSGE